MEQCLQMNLQQLLTFLTNQLQYMILYLIYRIKIVSQLIKQNESFVINQIKQMQPQRINNYESFEKTLFSKQIKSQGHEQLSQNLSNVSAFQFLISNQQTALKSKIKQVDQFNICDNLDYTIIDNSPTKLHIKPQIQRIQQNYQQNIVTSKNNIKQPIQFKNKLLTQNQVSKHAMKGLINQIYFKINQKQAQNYDLSILKHFVNTPLPGLSFVSTRFQFQVHYYKYTFTFHSYYQFWIKNPSNGDMIQILTAQKDSLSMSSSYMISTTNPWSPRKQRELIGKLKHNKLKTQYNLQKIKQSEDSKQRRVLLATILFQSSFINDEKTLTLYCALPNHRNDFLKLQQKPNLAAYFKQFQTSQQIQPIKKFSSGKRNRVEEKQIQQLFNLKTDSNRKLLLKDYNANQILYNAKIQDNRYLLLTSSGITPLQIFATSIVNLDH